MNKIKSLNLFNISFVIFFCLCLTFYFLLLDSSPVIEGGKSGYVVLAKSIIEGRGYRDIELIDSPGHTAWPPVVPLILAPFVYFFNLNFLFLKLPNIILGIISLPLIYLFLKKIEEQEKWFAFIIMIFTGFSANIIYYAHTTWSDIPYLFFGILTLIFLERYYKETKCFTYNALFSIVFLLLAHFTRLIGLSLFFASITYFLFEPIFNKKRIFFKKIFFLSIPYVLFIFLWWLRNIQIISVTENILYKDLLVDPFGTFGTYENISLSFVNKIIHLLQNIYAMIFYILPKILTGLTFTSRNFMSIFLVAIILIGFLSKICRKRSLIDYYNLFYTLVLLIWPRTALLGDRYFVPFVPFIFYYFFLGMSELQKILKIESKQIKFVVNFASIFIIFFVNCMGIYSYIGKTKKEIIFKNNFLEMACWIKKNTPTDAIFASTDAAAVYLFTERKSMNEIISFSGKLEDSFFRLENAYVIEAPILGDQFYIKNSINEYSNRFKAMFLKNENKVYKLLNQP